MPWSCPNFDGTAGPPRTFVTATSSSFGQPTPVQSPVVPPDWVSDIWNLLCAEGVPDDDEDELVIFVNSYYIDHHTHRYHAEARPLRFDQNVQEWNRDVQLIWEDFLDHSVPFVVTLVRPLPPTLVYRGTVATVIVHQHLDLDRTACLITSVYAAAPAPHFHESAHSIERRIAPTRLVQLAGAAEVCQQCPRDGHGECTLHVGFQHVPMTPDVETAHGLGFTLRIPPEMSIAELEQNLHHRLQRQSPLSGGSHANLTAPPELAHPAPNGDLPDPNSTAPTKFPLWLAVPFCTHVEEVLTCVRAHRVLGPRRQALLLRPHRIGEVRYQLVLTGEHLRLLCLGMIKTYYFVHLQSLGISLGMTWCWHNMFPIDLWISSNKTCNVF